MARKIGKERRYINNLSRAINKIDESLTKTFLVASHNISDVKTGINDIEFKIDGKTRKVKYSDISTLPDDEQASLWGGLAQERTKTREMLALEQLKEKGGISSQFKRALRQGDVKLLEHIQQFEDITKGNKKEVIKEEFEGITIKSIEDELDNFFQSDDGNGLTGSDKQFDFYRPGESGGFSELNTFTMNAYRMLSRG